MLGGVPAGKIRYDNLKAAVAQVIGFSRSRVETDRWTAFRSHWGFSELCGLSCLMAICSYWPFARRTAVVSRRALRWSIPLSASERFTGIPAAMLAASLSMCRSPLLHGSRPPLRAPPRPACLTHGDLWASNILATDDGRPALIDPAVSYTWAEVDLAHLWSSPHPPEAKRFFDVYAELAGLDDDWRARMPVIQLRQHLAVIAQFDHDWGAAQQVRATLKPFRRQGRHVRADGRRRLAVQASGARPR